MPTKTRGRTKATPKSTCKQHSTGMATRITALIVEGEA